MLPAQIIALKRDGGELSDSQIGQFIAGFASEQIPDYQMSAFAMAVFFNGMTAAETASLTHHMLESGTKLTWPNDGIARGDKHSTGGVGDKVSIPLAPILACCGIQVPMLSGRGLGATGGTLDKLESLNGYRTDLSLDEVTRLTQEVGCVITGASPELAPADRRLYALRDVTGTVPSIPLITASIMSKKLAESPDALVLDVKYGSGAFMKTYGQARALAVSLVRTGEQMSVRTTALLTDMNQPLGRMCGNAVEIQESFAVLRGNGPEDVRTLSLDLAAELLCSARIFETVAAARETAERTITDGTAWEKLNQMIRAQGSSGTSVHVAPAAEVVADRSGIVQAVDTEQLGLAVIKLGGGRRKMSDAIDHSVGLEYLVRVGDSVESGQPLVRVFAQNVAAVQEQIGSAITIADTGEPLTLVAERLTIDNC